MCVCVCMRVCVIPSLTSPQQGYVCVCVYCVRVCVCTIIEYADLSPIFLSRAWATGRVAAEMPAAVQCKSLCAATSAGQESFEVYCICYVLIYMIITCCLATESHYSMRRLILVADMSHGSAAAPTWLSSNTPSSSLFFFFFFFFSL